MLENPPLNSAREAPRRCLAKGKFRDENRRQDNQGLRSPVLLSHLGVITSFTFSNRVRQMVPIIGNLPGTALTGRNP
jgi:hypothetical protein